MELTQFLILGLGTGALYALTAQGLVLIYRGSGVVNFAQGAVGMVGAFVFYETRDVHGLPSALAWLAAIAASVLIGVGTNLIIMRRLRTASPLVRLVSTLGVLFLLVAIATEVWGEGGRPVASPLPAEPRAIFGGEVVVPEFRFWLIALAIVVTAALWLLYTRTSFGRATEAVAENPRSAAALGISPDTISAVNWALGSTLAAVTAILLAPILFLSVVALSFVVLRGLAAALLGGFRSFWITLAGAFGIGVVEAQLGNLYPASPGLSRSAAFIVIVVVLVVTGRALPLRSELLDRMPALGTGRIRWIPVLLTIVLVAGFVASADTSWTGPLIVTFSAGLVALSVVVVTGYVGQLSLAQFGLAGLAAWAAGRLVADHGLSFPLATLLGVAFVVPVGLLIALPALRTRGVNLAVITFGLASVIYEMVLNDGNLTGGVEGTNVGKPTLFGLEVDGIAHPDRYALVALACLVLCCLAVANLRRGRAGRWFVAVRDNERAAASLGIPVYGVKLLAFGIAAAIAGLGGILLAFRQDIISFQAFSPIASIEIVVLSVIGGVGFVLGSLVAGVLTLGGAGGRLLQAAGSDGSVGIISGVVLIVLLLTDPDGLVHAVGRLRALLPRRRKEVEGATEVDALPPSLVPTQRVRRLAEPTSLRVEGLTVSFGVTKALDEVSFEVAPGEVVGLIGPNGAGKTTVIDAVTGFVRPSSGHILLGEEGVERWSAGRRSRAGIARAFQSLELFEDLTVLENVQAGCDRGSVLGLVGELVRPTNEPLSPEALAAIDEFGLREHLQRRPSELSYGHRRLVAIARAVATRPRVILLDEPAAGLDDHERSELGHLVRNLASDWGMAVLLVEHDVSLVARVCDRIVALDFGQVIADGPTAEVVASDELRAAYLGEESVEVDGATGASAPSGRAQPDEPAESVVPT